MRKLSSKTRRRPLRFFRLTISSRTRREINRNAKAAASRNWTPSDTQPEPHWVVEWDGEIKAAIADGISRFETSVTTVLQTIAQFNDTTEVCLPPVLERTPEARRIFLAHAHYTQLRHDANAAVVNYEQRRQSLIRDIKANLDLSEVGRGAFYSKMSEFHPRPELIDDRNSTPLTWTDIGLASRAVLERSQLTIDRARLKLGLDEAEIPAAAPGAQATLTRSNHPDPTPPAELSMLRTLENGS
jgi:hypothetical protein